MITAETPWEEIESLVREAVAELKEKDSLLFQVKGSERSITHRLAVYLEKRFEGWQVDCEYSRIEKNGDYKVLLHPDGKIKTHWLDIGGSRIFPDIVVHNRGKVDRQNNLLVIEVKTTWNRDDESQDLFKLKALTGGLTYGQLVCYKFGAFLKFDQKAHLVDFQIFESETQESPLE
ncbi:hypothetical protein [Bremerella volcania]|uniref:hypothetical protein n=1 Tax=Bremerella volcania TaxID=2527984 RepID=UPI0011A6D253|nr:hypothetical protein [Bremerella volcania]